MFPTCADLWVKSYSYFLMSSTQICQICLFVRLFPFFPPEKMGGGVWWRGCVCVLVFVFVFFPTDDGRTEEKEQEKLFGYFFLCLELNGSMFMLNSLCSEMLLIVILSDFLFVWSEFREIICFCFPQG